MVVLEPLNKLLQQKWETFASKRFYFSFISYLSFMIIFTAIAYYQPLRVKVGPVFLSGRPGWMEQGLKGYGWLSTLPLPVSTALGGFGFVLQPSFPVEFTAGGFLWVSGLIIILLGGIYLIFAQVGGSLVRFHCKMEKKREQSLAWRQQIQISMCRSGWQEGILLWDTQWDLAVTGAAQARGIMVPQQQIILRLL